MASIHENVRDYYGEQLKQSSDLKTDACCTKTVVPNFVKDIIKKIHPDILSRYYGCGLVFPPKLEDCRVLDLGSGSGRDVYILSSLVGPKGYVVGVDMTEAQVDIAKRFIDYHRKQFGFELPNIEFRLGKIEELTNDSELKTDSFDVVISNCVVNLTPDKRKVLEQVYAMLKPGGEFYFSDVYADRPVPEELQENKVLWGECLSGAICESDLISWAIDIGFTRPILVNKEPICIQNKEFENLIGEIKFTSCTYRLFKNKSIDFIDQFGAFVSYQIPIIHSEDQFQLDQSTTFFTNGQSQYLNVELTHILRLSRYSHHFKFEPIIDENLIPKPLPNSTKQVSKSNCCC